MLKKRIRPAFCAVTAVCTLAACGTFAACGTGAADRSGAASDADNGTLVVLTYGKYLDHSVIRLFEE